MHLGDGQRCGEKEKDGIVEGGRHWGAVLDGAGQKRFPRD